MSEELQKQLTQLKNPAFLQAYLDRIDKIQSGRIEAIALPRFDESILKGCGDCEHNDFIYEHGLQAGCELLINERCRRGLINLRYGVCPKSKFANGQLSHDTKRAR